MTAVAASNGDRQYGRSTVVTSGRTSGDAGSRTLGRLWSQYFDIRSTLEEFDGGVAPIELRRREKKLRDRLVTNYSPLVKYVVGRVSGRMTGGANQEDFASWGIVGLLDAVETFNPHRGAKFETYAISKIRWAILDELRKQDWVPRRLRQQAQQTQATITRLTQRLRRSPTDGEVAEALGVEVAEYRKFMGQYSQAQVASLESDDDTNDGLHGLLADQNCADPQSETDAADLRTQLVDAIDQLTERERVVVTFYYYEGLTLREIGKALQLTEGRISQLLRKALTKLNENLSQSPASAA